MEQHYLINNKVLFNTHENLLIDINTPSLKVSLNRPIARCLQLLIDNQGKITHQEEFFEYVWRSRGASITANTYYQNISILRRSLAHMGLGDEIIKTVSRKGLMFSQASEVTSHAAGENPFSEKKNALLVTDMLVPENKERTEEKHATDSYEERSAHYLPALFSKRNKRYDSFKLTALLTIFFSVIAVAAWEDTIENLQEDFFSDYSYIESVNLCKVYSNHTFLRDEKIPLDEKLLRCDKEKKVFLTYYIFSPDVHLLTCQEKSSPTPFSSCISYYFTGGIIENEKMDGHRPFSFDHATGLPDF